MDLKNILKNAQKNKYAVGQFNFSTLEQLRAILSAAGKLKTPVILAVSEGELGYLGLEETVALAAISNKKYGGWGFLNLDHGKDAGLIKKAVDYGFSAVHFDGSALPLEKNIKYVKNIVQYAHKRNVLVEGELEEIGGKNRTSLCQVKRFVGETKIDSLALAMGNKHGYYINVRLNFDRLKEIQKAVKCFLVLHGGSGVPNKQIKKAVNLGITKVNINTELRIAWKNSLKNSLRSKEIKPYNIMSDVQNIIQKKVEEKIKLFNI